MLRLRPYKEIDAQTITSWLTDERAFYLWSAVLFISDDGFSGISAGPK